MGKRRTLLASHRPSTCNSKKIYNNKKEANGVAARARIRTGHVNIEAYKCPYRSHYHIGHQRRGGREMSND